MWTNDSIFQEDIRDISRVNFIPWEELRGASLLITGGTGLIGYTLIRGLLYANQERNLGLVIYAMARDLDRARKRFSLFIDDSALRLVEGSVESISLEDMPEKIDYIVHGASQTASRGFVETPVETIDTAVEGTKHLLELAKSRQVKGFIYLSSMEVYGFPQRGHKVKEEEIGELSPLDVRNSYPISKIMCESMCVAYAKEYSVPTKVIRLTQTFGPGISDKDNRIFAYFARCVMEKKDIVLKTKGETERCYLYTADAVTAILISLLKGENGEAYNAADEKTYCAISEMAEKVAKDGGVHVIYDIQDEKKNGFPQTIYMNLDTNKLRALGWKPIGGAVN